MIEDNFLNQVVEQIEDKMGEDIVVIDVQGVTTMTDYIACVTANSLSHANSLAGYIVDFFREKKQSDLLYNRKPQHNNEWVLLDAGYFVVNIFLKEAREFYQIEKLYFKGDVVYKGGQDSFEL